MKKKIAAAERAEEEKKWKNVIEASKYIYVIKIRIPPDYVTFLEFVDRWCGRRAKLIVVLNKIYNVNSSTSKTF